MSIHSADSALLLTDVYDEYRRYERYLAVAYAAGFAGFLMLLLPGPLWGGSAALVTLLVVAFRRYHRVVHLYVGAPNRQTDRQLQLWGTAAQACVWGAMPILAALFVLQVMA